MAAASRIRACWSATCLALSSPKSCARFISLNIRSLLCIQAGEGFVDADLSARDLFHQLHARRSRRHRALDADLGQQGIETGPCRRIADAEVAFQLLHVPARGEKHPQHVAILIREHAELAGRKTA